MQRGPYRYLSRQQPSGSTRKTLRHPGFYCIISFPHRIVMRQVFVVMFHRQRHLPMLHLKSVLSAVQVFFSALPCFDLIHQFRNASGFGQCSRLPLSSIRHGPSRYSCSDTFLYSAPTSDVLLSAPRPGNVFKEAAVLPISGSAVLYILHNPQ